MAEQHLYSQNSLHQTDDKQGQYRKIKTNTGKISISPVFLYLPSFFASALFVICLIIEVLHQQM